MSAGVEGSSTPDADQSTVTMTPPPVVTSASAHEHQHHHHVLIEPDEDRWQWRRRIRQNRRKLAVYRVGVAIAGLLMVCLGFVSGPLPGPGGIPLVLLGLAIWSSEFEWAYKLLQWFKVLLHRYKAWPRRMQVLFWVGFFVACGSLGYGYMLLIDVPGWLPNSIETVLMKLPGL